MRRILVVLAAYLCAVFIVVDAVLLFGLLSGWELDAAVKIFYIFLLATSVFAAPVALPVILFTELRNSGRWIVFAIAGLVLGVLLTIAFSEIPIRSLNIELALTMVLLSIVGAMTYWLIAWRLLPRGSSVSLEVE